MRVVAVTGYGQEVDRARTREAGFDKHLVKPVDVGRLELWLRRIQHQQTAAPDVFPPHPGRYRGDAPA